jgi:hypothetical protein
VAMVAYTGPVSMASRENLDGRQESMVWMLSLGHTLLVSVFIAEQFTAVFDACASDARIASTGGPGIWMRILCMGERQKIMSATPLLVRHRA